MKAVIYTTYGGPEVLRVEEGPKPAPRDKEILIKVRATTVTTADVNARNFVFVPRGFKTIARLMFGWKRPKLRTLGFELAGVVEAVGREVSRYNPGDEVFGVMGEKYGAYAEYVCLPETACLAPRPANLTAEEAATLPIGATTALYFLRDLGRVKAGERILVNGASGAVGSYAVQLAKHIGAETTGVCSTANLDLVRSLGADRVVDYTKEDVTAAGESYDAVMDTVGKLDFVRVRGALNRSGRFLSVAGGPSDLALMAWTGIVGGKRVMAGRTPDRQEDLLYIKRLAEEGKLRPVIDRRYSLDEVAEAHRYVDTGRKRGCVAVTVG